MGLVQVYVEEGLIEFQFLLDADPLSVDSFLNQFVHDVQPIRTHPALTKPDIEQEPFAAGDEFDPIVGRGLGNGNALLFLFDDLLIAHDLLQAIQHPTFDSFLPFLNILFELDQKLSFVLVECGDGLPIDEEHPQLVLPMQEMQVLFATETKWLRTHTTCLNAEI